MLLCGVSVRSSEFVCRGPQQGCVGCCGLYGTHLGLRSVNATGSCLLVAAFMQRSQRRPSLPSPVRCGCGSLPRPEASACAAASRSAAPPLPPAAALATPLPATATGTHLASLPRAPPHRVPLPRRQHLHHHLHCLQAARCVERLWPTRLPPPPHLYPRQHQQRPTQQPPNYASSSPLRRPAATPSSWTSSPLGAAPARSSRRLLFLPRRPTNTQRPSPPLPTTAAPTDSCPRLPTSPAELPTLPLSHRLSKKPTGQQPVRRRTTGRRPRSRCRRP